MKNWVPFVRFESTTEFYAEDRGRALVATICDAGEAHESAPPGVAEEMFVRLQSWADDPAAPGAHAGARALAGRRIRVTVEVLNED